MDTSLEIICWEPIGAERWCGRTIGSVEDAAPHAGRPGWYAINSPGSRAVYLGDNLDVLRGEQITMPIIACTGDPHVSYLAPLAPGDERMVRMKVRYSMLLSGDDVADQRRRGVRATNDKRGSSRRPAKAADPMPDPYRWPQVVWPSGASTGLMMTLGTSHGPVMSPDGTIRGVPPKRPTPPANG